MLMQKLLYDNSQKAWNTKMYSKPSVKMPSFFSEQIKPVSPRQFLSKE